MLKSHFAKHGVIHLLWIIAILVLALIGVIERVDSGIQLYNYISFAAAISSILLALVAIIYSIFSGQSLSESIGSLRNSTTSIDVNAVAVKDSADAMGEALASFRETISHIPASVETMSADLSRRLDQIAVKDAQQTTSTEPSINADDISGDFFPSLSSLPLGVTYALYVLEQSKIHNKQFSSQDVSDSAYIQGTVFGTCSLISELKLCGADIRRVTNNFYTLSLGKFDFEATGPLLEAQKAQSIRDLKKYGDNYFQPPNADEVTKGETPSPPSDG